MARLPGKFTYGACHCRDCGGGHNDTRRRKRVEARELEREIADEVAAVAVLTRRADSQSPTATTGARPHPRGGLKGMSLILDDSQLELLEELASMEAERLDREAQRMEGGGSRARKVHAERMRERAAHARITLAELRREIDARAAIKPH
jgi:hypothetical protein